MEVGVMYWSIQVLRLNLMVNFKCYMINFVDIFLKVSILQHALYNRSPEKFMKPATTWLGE